MSLRRFLMLAVPFAVLASSAVVAVAEPIQPTQPKMYSLLAKLEKTPCVCNDGGPNAGHAGIVYATASEADVSTGFYFVPKCQLYTWDSNTGAIFITGPLCFPFIPLTR
ncbi:MAG TPA: hypothetical protein VFD92_19335 [Candidatus Binatia bacterium]|nr:hypothetical protein [Candidatus Binatia bacterium]